MIRFSMTHAIRGTAARWSAFHVREEDARGALESILEDWPLDPDDCHLEDALERLEAGRWQMLRLIAPAGHAVLLEVSRVAD